MQEKWIKCLEIPIKPWHILIYICTWAGSRGSGKCLQRMLRAFQKNMSPVNHCESMRLKFNVCEYAWCQWMNYGTGYGFSDTCSIGKWLRNRWCLHGILLRYLTKTWGWSGERSNNGPENPNKVKAYSWRIIGEVKMLSQLYCAVAVTASPRSSKWKIR